MRFGMEHENLRESLLREIEMDEKLWDHIHTTFIPLPNGNPEFKAAELKKRDLDRSELLDKIHSRTLKNKIQLYELIKKEFE